MKNYLLLALSGVFLLSSCKKDKPEPQIIDNGGIDPGPHLNFKYKFDSTQVRLDNFGNPSSVPSGNGAQSPVFYGMSSHYIELAPNQWTQLGDGEIVFEGAVTNAGGATAVDFDQAHIAGDDEVFFSIPLSQLSPGTYEWIRASLTYQNYNINYKAQGFNLTGRLASFVGFNTYITDHTIQNQTVSVNGNKLQGYWAFESAGQISSGDAAQTTVPNPISSTSPVPAGSCVVTGQFGTPLVITGNETEDITIVLSLSTNNSFEWSDAAGNNIFEPLAGDTVVDMGLRGLIPIIEP